MPIQNEEERIKLLQDNLRTIRLLCGWTLDDFGRQLGVTKQTISRLENDKVEMNRAMYIAIRAILEKRCSEEKSLGVNYNILVNTLPLLLREGEGEKLSDLEYKGIKRKFETMAAAYFGKAKKSSISYSISEAIAAIPTIGAVGGAVAGAAALFLGTGVGLNSGFPWLVKLLTEDKQKNETSKTKEQD